MVKSISMCVALALVWSLASLAHADEAKAFKGTLACGKCVLKDESCKVCTNVLQVKDGEQTITYYLADNDVSKAAHAKVCKEAVANVTVTGLVEEKDGKKWLTATKIEFPEAPKKD